MEIHSFMHSPNFRTFEPGHSEDLLAVVDSTVRVSFALAGNLDGAIAAGVVTAKPDCGSAACSRSMEGKAQSGAEEEICAFKHDCGVFLSTY